MRLVVGAIVTAIAGAAMAGWLIARTSSPPAGPVILISIDALRSDHLGAYGDKNARTPNIDALAAAGVVFERAYAHSPLTVPAHVSILSGRLPFETGVRDDEDARVPAKPPLLPALLHRRGFKTAGVVSSALLGRQSGLAEAFDFFDDEMPARAPSGPAASVERDGAATIEVAKRWVDQQGQRFFLFLHLNEPRAPYAPRDGQARNPYDGEVRRADQLVGEFLQFLKERELYDPAIIVLTSDHGEALGEHGEAEHGVFLYNSTLHTPLVVKMPNDEGGGRRRSDVVQQIDILPTLLDLMGAPRPASLRGRSLKHLIESADATLPGAAVYSESIYPRLHFGWSELASVTDGRYRFVRAPRPELYDLLQDRGERQNIAPANPAKVAELSGVLDKFLAAATPATRLTAEDREALAGLLAPDPEARTTSVEITRVPDAAAPAAADLIQPAPADPKDRVGLLDKLCIAKALVSEGRVVDAVGAYKAIVAADPGVPDAWRQLGSLLLATGDARASLEAFREAMRLNIEDAAAILGASGALTALGKPEEAERHAALAAKLDPVRANELLVRLELGQKDYAGAHRAAAAAREADEGSPMPALVDGVERYQAGEYAEALPRLEEAVRLAAGRPVQTPDVLFYTGDTLAQLRKYSDAEARLTDELKWFPENVRAREALALVYQATGRAADVPALITDLIKTAPTAEGYAAAAALSASVGDTTGAATLRARARQLFGDAAQRAAEEARKH
jgi:tetratricopeptide (TPR) repeat protein